MGNAGCRVDDPLVGDHAPGDLGTLVEEAKKGREFLDQLTEPSEGR